jgi:hypothetical protein
MITHKVKHEDSKTGVAGGMTLCHLVSVVSQKAFSGTVWEPEISPSYTCSV